MINLPVLVLNQNYEPLNVCDVRRAVVLMDKGKGRDPRKRPRRACARFA